MSTGTIRPRKDGCGCSICRASEENVGKRRCCHVLGGTTMTYVKSKGMNIVEISGTLDKSGVNVGIPATPENISQGMMSFGEGLPKKVKDSIFKILHENGY